VKVFLQYPYFLVQPFCPDVRIMQYLIIII
jgi:hypothetical protein